jgi:FkbM family methyltransferase
MIKVLVNLLKSIKISPKKVSKIHKNKILKKIVTYESSLNWLYNKLEDEESKQLLVKIMAFRYLGHRKVKLPLNNLQYWHNLKNMEIMADKTDFIQICFNNLVWKLYKINLELIGVPIILYDTIMGAYILFDFQQYRCKHGNEFIQAEGGDIVIDAGSCYGDSALYFANKVGENGHIYSFEFIPSNLSVFTKNIMCNPVQDLRISVIKKALWSHSDLSVGYIDSGPASNIVVNSYLENAQGKVNTITIDDFVRLNNITRIDFIKMDIESSELAALKGAIETLSKYKPKLAISVYHKFKDFIDIPEFIISLDLDYKLYLRHATIHAEETV